MGYYTNFDLSYELSGPGPDPAKIAKITKLAEEEGIKVIVPCSGLEEFEEYCDDESSCEYGRLSQFFNGYGDSCKWYNFEEDCKQTSKLHPNILMTLRGEGEEPGDQWIRYFLNGKMQVCQAQISYEEYDESKLL